MKDTRAILYNLAAEQGWCGATMLELCLNYIEAQESNEAFEDPEWWGYKVYMTGEEEWGGPTMAGVIPKENLEEVDTEPVQLSFS